MAVLKIYAPIMDDEDRVVLQYFGLDGVSFKSVDEFLSSMDENDTEIDLRLHCDGGSVFEGWAIHDRLRASGKTITSTIEGNCASMASILLLAGSKRRANPHATLLIHDPFVSLYGDYTADKLGNMHEDLKAQRDKILDYYVERTGSDRKTIDKMMKRETMLNMDEAKQYGFIDEIVAPISAMSKGNQFFNNMASKSNFLKKLFGAITATVDSEGGFTDYRLNTADGGVIELEKEAGDPQVGDKATPDGEFLMPSGETYVISDGVITEIRQPDKNAADNKADRQNEPKDSEEVTALKAQVADLSAQVQSLTNDLNAAKAESDSLKPKVKSALEMEVLNLVTVAGGSLEGGRDWLVKNRSDYKPEDRSITKQTKVAGESDNPISRMLAEAKKANGITEKAE